MGTLNLLNFDWTVEGSLYNVTVEGDHKDWRISEAEIYDEVENRTHVISQCEFEEIEKILDNDNKFIDYVEQQFSEYSAEMAEWYRDQEIDRRIDEELMDKAYAEERSMELDAIDKEGG